MKKLKKIERGVPAVLQFDSWWLDHDSRPFPKPANTAKLVATEAHR